MERKINQENLKTPIILVPLAHGDIYDKEGQGDEIFPKEKELSVNRFRKGIVQIYKDFKRKPDMIISLAGYNRENPKNKEIGVRVVSLAEQLGRWVKENREKISEETEMILNPEIWSTEKEVRFAFKKIKEKYGNKKVIVYLASNQSHIPRIAMYANLFASKNMEIRYSSVNRKFRPKDSMILEPAKIVRDIAKFVKILLRVKRRSKINKNNNL